MRTRDASFALRIVRRHEGDAGIVYRRSLNPKGQERLTKIGTLSPLAFSAGVGLMRMGARESNDKNIGLSPGPFIPLSNDWGARVACYALIASGLRDASRLSKAATHLQYADGTEAAWWLGLMNRDEGQRSVRALRILTEAVQ